MPDSYKEKIQENSEIKKEVQGPKCQNHNKQIQKLVDLAFQRGLSHAIEVAKGLNNPHILDEFHDTLVDQLYDELAKRGEIKKI